MLGRCCSARRKRIATMIETQCPLKRDHVGRMLTAQPTLSNYRVARLAKVSEGYVRDRRAALGAALATTWKGTPHGE